MVWKKKLLNSVKQRYQIVQDKILTVWFYMSVLYFLIVEIAIRFKIVFAEMLQKLLERI